MYRLKRLAIYFFAIGLAFAGAMTLQKKFDAWQSSHSLSSAEGRIVEFSVVGGKSEKRYPYKLKYKFKVEEQTYEGRQLFAWLPESDKLSKEEYRRYKNRFRVNQAVTVYYDPADPGNRSYLEKVPVHHLAIPAVSLLFGLWVLYLLRVTRARQVPKRVLQTTKDENDPHWLRTYQSALEHEQIEIEGKAWYSYSSGIGEWLNSRVGMVANPNTVVVVRGPYTAAGLGAALVTLVLEIRFYFILAIFHGTAFFSVWKRRKATWEMFKQETSPDAYPKVLPYAAEVVSIDSIRIYGFDPKRRELWYRLARRPVDDCIKLSPTMADQIDTFIGFIELMQRANQPLPEATHSELGDA